MRPKLGAIGSVGYIQSLFTAAQKTTTTLANSGSCPITSQVYSVGVGEGLTRVEKKRRFNLITTSIDGE